MGPYKSDTRDPSELTPQDVGVNRRLEARARDGLDCEDLRDAGGFRPALYYRLASSRIKIPPLRERREDVVPLARAFLDALRRRGEVDGEYLGPEAARDLLAHRWPGNVRELQNAVRAAVYAKGPSGMGHIGRFLDGSGGLERLGTHQEMREALGREPSALELQVVCELEARWRCSIRTLADVLCVNRETLRRRLEPLIRMGIVARGGQGRGAWVEMGRGE